MSAAESHIEIWGYEQKKRTHTHTTDDDPHTPQKRDRPQKKWLQKKWTVLLTSCLITKSRPQETCTQKLYTTSNKLQTNFDAVHAEIVHIKQTSNKLRRNYDDETPIAELLGE